MYVCMYVCMAGECGVQQAAAEDLFPGEGPGGEAKGTHRTGCRLGHRSHH